MVASRVQTVGGGAAQQAYRIDAAVSSGDCFWHTQWADVATDRMNSGLDYVQIKSSIPLSQADFVLGKNWDSTPSLFPTRIAGNTGAAWIYTVDVRP